MIKIDDRFEDVKMVKNVTLIEADPNSKSIKKILCNDGSVIDLYLKNIFTEMTEEYIPSTEHIVFDGVIAKVPQDLNTPNLKLEVKPGDHVLCHHFLCSPENMVEIEGKRYFMFDYVFDYVTYQLPSVYAKITDDGLEMIGGWNLLTPVKDGHEELRKQGIEIPFEKEFQNVGEVEWCNNELGLKKGDKVAFDKNSDYEIEFGGKKYYRVNNRDIAGVFV